jgi:DNA-binding response OmpR family regulator
MHIAILDDDGAEIGHVREILTARGHLCAAASSAAGMLALLRRDTFDLLVLDWMLPESSGLEVVQWVRANIAAHPPILMITARAEEADIVQALNAGADDYVTKPVTAPLLIARIDALLRRAYGEASPGGIETYGPYVFDTVQGAVSLRGVAMALTSREFDLALLLFRNANRALSRSYILNSISGWNSELASRTLDIHVSRVRAKLALQQGNDVRLAPIYGYGYRLELATTPKMGDAG